MRIQRMKSMTIGRVAGLALALGLMGTVEAASKDTTNSDVLVNILANSVVKGEVLVSPTVTNPISVVSVSESSSTDGVGSLSKDPSLPTSIAAPANATDLGAFELKGKTQWLDPGVYKASSVSLTSDAILYTRGKVELYVTGSFYQHRGLLYGQAAGLSPSGQFSPKDLRIFVVPTGDAKQSVRFEGGLTAAVVYAKDLEVRIDPNHTFIGAVIGKSMNVTNSSIYYPKDLATVIASVNTSAPVAELLWFRNTRLPLAQTTSGFLPGDVEWNPNAPTIPSSSLLVWGDAGNGWYTWPGSPPAGGGGSGNGCFLAGTPILLADGMTKPIEQVQVGDLVLAFDEATGTFKKDRVKKTFVHPDEPGYLLINGHLRVTPNHPVYSNGHWVEIGTLQAGDPLMNAQGQPEPITSVERVEERVTVYNFEVNPYHTYVAGGIVAHNKNNPSKLQ